ncbi:MAG TPA: TonB-dependent receptor, partial [Myxococcota bacterium]|nr:TonB-dependent receptor [Myxococcota bacterium]
EDNGLFPSFVSSPIGDYGLDFVSLQDPEPQGTVAGYLQHAWDGPVRTRAGVRSTWVQRDGRFLLSPSLGLAVPLPTATIPKISAGLYQRVVEEPLLIDPVHGNPGLLPERSAQVVVGVDQGLPIGEGGLLRIEGYYAKLDQLAVTPDDPGVRVAGESYLSIGSGHNMGVDLLFALRSERISGALNASYVDSWRINPLNATFPQRVRPKEWQPLTLGLSLEWQAAPAWRLTARYDYHTGRPMSSVEAGPDDTLTLTGLNDDRLGDFHQLDLRAEWRKALPRVRWSVYLEVLNVTYARSDFMPIASVENGELTMSMFSHLPTRPFLGVRADF